MLTAIKKEKFEKFYSETSLVFFLKCTFTRAIHFLKELLLDDKK